MRSVAAIIYVLFYARQKEGEKYCAIEASKTREASKNAKNF